MRRFILCSLLLCLTNKIGAEELVNTHEDITLNYDSGTSTLSLAVRDENLKREYRPDHVFHRIPVGAKLTIPNNPAFSFLGSVGASTWILPQTQNTSLLYVGLSTENKISQSGWQAIGVTTGHHRRGISTGTFQTNSIKFILTRVIGPGHFTLYSNNAGGSPTVHLNSRDGITATDQLTYQPNSHSHYNWAFSARGFYQIFLKGRATLNSGTVIESPETGFYFGVEATPYTYANWAAGYELTYGLSVGTLANHFSGDWDRDGLLNGVEYALQWMGADPGLPQLTLARPIRDGSSLTLDYLRDSLKSDCTIQPQSSSQLSSWFGPSDAGRPSGFTDVLNESRTTAGTVEARRSALTIGPEARKFLRLRVNTIP
jgi:surface-anchored protein